MSHTPIFLDCTFRDGGYYNDWDFSAAMATDYLRAMAALGVDYVELGFRSLETDGFRGPFAYTTDAFIRELAPPSQIKLAVMVNASEIVHYSAGAGAAIAQLFAPAAASPVSLVRLATHYRDLDVTLAAADRIKSLGYAVGVNVMQISERTYEALEGIGRAVSSHPLDVLYFADSMGCLTPDDVAGIAASLRRHWHGSLGIHAHDNLGLALANTLRAYREGTTWLDTTVTGMGRGPGNAKTEYLALEMTHPVQGRRELAPLLTTIREHFEPLLAEHRWGTNPYYYLAGKLSIHPTYIQEMLHDSRYNDEDILAVIQHLQQVDGTKYNAATLEAGRHFFRGEPRGTWCPKDLINGREVLIVGAGPSAVRYRDAVTSYIDSHRPFVIALNTQDAVAPGLVDIRAACHPVRLLADCDRYSAFSEPLATPATMLPDAVREALGHRHLLDYGLTICPGSFEAGPNHCVLPNTLVLGYALAIAAAGGARRVLLSGFDGYSGDDPRRAESDSLLQLFVQYASAPPVIAITPTKYKIPSRSVYAL
jgi:4-hydroxy 2-oxovalerate aldolase